MRDIRIISRGLRIRFGFNKNGLFRVRKGLLDIGWSQLQVRSASLKVKVSPLGAKMGCWRSARATRMWKWSFWRPAEVVGYPERAPWGSAYNVLGTVIGPIQKRALGACKVALRPRTHLLQTNFDKKASQAVRDEGRRATNHMKYDCPIHSYYSYFIPYKGNDFFCNSSTVVELHALRT